MIPKVIHYCWFGHNPMPELVKDCIQSWKNNCPDYELKLWTEDNFDVNQTRYCMEAYQSRKWAFVADYARLKVLYEYGGVYLDTDVEILKNIDCFLSDSCFMGFEHGGVNSGLIAGSEKGHRFINLLLEKYERQHFIESDGTLNMKSCVEYTTELLAEYGLSSEDEKQVVCGVTVYPTTYFCPRNQYTEKINITANTYTMHHYLGTWADDTVKYGQELKKKYVKKLGAIGKVPYYIHYTYYVLRQKGIGTFFQKVKRKVSILVYGVDKKR